MQQQGPCPPHCLQHATTQSRGQRGCQQRYMSRSLGPAVVSAMPPPVTWSAVHAGPEQPKQQLPSSQFTMHCSSTQQCQHLLSMGAAGHPRLQARPAPGGSGGQPEQRQVQCTGGTGERGERGHGSTVESSTCSSRMLQQASGSELHQEQHRQLQHLNRRAAGAAVVPVKTASHQGRGMGYTYLQP